MKIAVHRLRKRYREILTEQIAETVESPLDINAELQHLYEAIAIRS